MLNTCVQVHYRQQNALGAEEAAARLQQENEFDSPLTSEFSWWTILAERPTTSHHKEWTIVSYGDLLDHKDLPEDLTFYGEYAGGGDYLIARYPTLSVKDNNTVHIYDPRSKTNLPLWPICQIDNKARHDANWYLFRGSRKLFVTEDPRIANTQIEDFKGNPDGQFELVPNEGLDLSNFNVGLSSLDWDYNLRLKYLIRVNSTMHIAIAEPLDSHSGEYARPYILSAPCRPCNYNAKYICDHVAGAAMR